jgi:uncharacterized protein (UPF0335 family)
MGGLPPNPFGPSPLGPPPMGPPSMGPGGMGMGPPMGATSMGGPPPPAMGGSPMGATSMGGLGGFGSPPPPMGPPMGNTSMGGPPPMGATSMGGLGGFGSPPPPVPLGSPPPPMPPPPVGSPSLGGGSLGGSPRGGPPPPAAGPGSLRSGPGGAQGGILDAAEAQRMQRRIDQLSSELRLLRGGGDKALRFEELEEKLSRLEKENQTLEQRYRELEKMAQAAGADYSIAKSVVTLTRAEEVVLGLNDVLSELRINLLATEGELEQYEKFLPPASYAMIRDSIRASRAAMDSARDYMRMLRDAR